MKKISLNNKLKKMLATDLRYTKQKLSERQLKEIKKLRNNGVTVRELAQQYNVAMGTITRSTTPGSRAKHNEYNRKHYHSNENRRKYSNEYAKKWKAENPKRWKEINIKALLKFYTKDE